MINDVYTARMHLPYSLIYMYMYVEIRFDIQQAQNCTGLEPEMQNVKIVAYKEIYSIINIIIKY